MLCILPAPLHILWLDTWHWDGDATRAKREMNATLALWANTEPHQAAVRWTEDTSYYRLQHCREEAVTMICLSLCLALSYFYVTFLYRIFMGHGFMFFYEFGLWRINNTWNKTKYLSNHVENKIVVFLKASIYFYSMSSTVLSLWYN